MPLPTITRRTELGQAGSILGQFADANAKFLSKSHKPNGALKDFEDWTRVAYRPTRFRFSGTGSWGVDADDVSYLVYSRMGHALHYRGAIVNTDVTAPLGTDLRVELPDGMVCHGQRDAIGITFYVDAGTGGLGFAVSIVGERYIALRKADGTNWTATAADNTSCIFNLTMEIA